MRQVRREFVEGKVRRGMISEREYKNYRWKVRRQREVCKHILVLVFTICLIVGMVVSYHSIITFAETDADEDSLSFKYYTEIEVAYGDSLWSIAQEYADDHYRTSLEYIKEVKNINHLCTDVIKEGQKLIIPYYSNEFK